MSAHKGLGKYKRYVAAYRPELRWKQTHVDLAFLIAFCEAKDRVRINGKRQPIRGFGGYHVSVVTQEDWES